MMMELWKSLETAPPSDRPLEDKTSDLYKAFGIYVKKLESNKLEELKKEVCYSHQIIRAYSSTSPNS